MTARITMTPTTCMIRRRRRDRSVRMLASRNSRPVSLSSTRVTSRRWRGHHSGNAEPPLRLRGQARRRSSATGSSSAPMSTVALASCRLAAAAPSSRPPATQSFAAFSTTRRARRAAACASISSLSGGQFTRNASCATPTTVRSPSASVDNSRRSTNGSSSSTMVLESSSRTARLLVGLPSASIVTRSSNAEMT